MKKFYFFTGGYTEPTKMGSGEIVPGRCKGITCYEFDEETERLTQLAVTSPVPNPSYVLVDPKEPYLYCVNELKDYEGIDGSTVSAYEIRSETGEAMDGPGRAVICWIRRMLELCATAELLL